MAKGISLHVGLNRVDPTAFRVPPLAGCVNDAEDMYKIAKSRGFYKRRLLVDEDATFERVVGAIEDAAEELVAGDIFLFTFAGHGTRVDDRELEELDTKDEALVLYDFMLLDDVLRRGLWPLFEAEVRVLMVADSCHSGTVSERMAVSGRVSVAERLSLAEAGVTLSTEMAVAAAEYEPVRRITDAARRRHLRKNRDFYEEFLRHLPENDPIEATILLLAACQDFATTGDRFENGVFTGALLEVWNDGGFDGDYERFRTEIESHPDLVSRTQQPRLTPTGTRLNPEFRFRAPIFTI